MHSRRAILLASTALVGIGSLTVWQDQALAVTCTAAAGVVTCSGASTTAADNPVIAGVVGSVTVNADATALIDTKTGGAALTVPATSNGAVVVTNLGTIGLAVADFPVGLQVIGDPTKTSAAVTPNNVSITNNKIINGAVKIGTSIADGAGGTATLANTAQITGSDGTATGVGVNIWSTGDATITSNAAGSIITGSVLLVSKAPGAPVATVDVTGKITTTAQPGGIASVNLGDVGLLKAITVNTVALAEWNPDGFAGSNITVSGIKGANATLSGHSGNLTITSTSAVGIVDNTSPPVDAAGNVTAVLKTTAISGASALGAQVSVLAGAQVIGTITATSPGGVSAQITGIVGLSPAGGTTVSLISGTAGGVDGTTAFHKVETDTTTVTDSKAIQTSSVTVNSIADVGGAVTLLIDPTGQINGNVITTSDKAQTITVNGAIGKLDNLPAFQATKGAQLVGGSLSIEAASQMATDTKTLTWADIAGVQTKVSSVDVNNTNTDTGGDVTFNEGSTGSIAGAVTVKTGGSLTGLISGLLNPSKNGTVALAADMTMSDNLGSETAVDTTVTTTDLFDAATGLITTSHQVTQTDIDTGGGATLTFDATSATLGSVTITTNAAQNITLAGKSAGTSTATGTWTLTGVGGSDSFSDTVTKESKAGLVTGEVINNNLLTDLGAAITFTEATTGKLSAPLFISTGGDVNATINGLLGLGTVNDTALSVIANAGFGAGGLATDRTVTQTDVYDATGLVVISRATTDNQSATGGLANVTIGAAANIAGNVIVTADGPIVFKNDGTISRALDGLAVQVANAGNVTITDSRVLTTKNNQSPIAFNTVKTVPTAPAISPVETKNTGSQSAIVKTVGNTVSFTNTNLNSITGFVSINALGNVTVNNSGWIIGDVKAMSDGFNTAVVNSASTDNLILFNDAANPTVFSQQTVTTATASNVTTSPIGGSVTGTYSGLDGITNNILDFTATNPTLVAYALTDLGAGQANTVTAGVGVTVVGGNGISASHIGIFQSADTTSSLTVSGTVYAGLCSVVGVNCGGNNNKVVLGSGFSNVSTPFSFLGQSGTTVVNSTSNIVDVINLDTATTPGSALLTGGTVTINTATTTSFTPTAGTSSTVVVSGRVASGLGPNVQGAPGTPGIFNGTDSDVFSSADFGSSITVSGNVEGKVEGDALGASTTTSDVLSQTFSIGGQDGTVVPPPGTPFVKDTNGATTETAFTETKIATQTGVGGASTISVTGIKGVYGALAFGATGATVTIDAASKVLASPREGTFGVWVSTANVPNDLISTTTVTRTYVSTTATQTTTNSQTLNSAAVSGNALATINGAVAGAVTVNSSLGTATATINNYVNNGFSTNAVVANATGFKQTQSSTLTQKDTTGSTAAFKLTPTGVALGAGGQPIAGVVIPAGDLGLAFGQVAFPIPTALGAFTTSKYVSAFTQTSAGGAATITLTAPASVISIGANTFNGILVNGDAVATGDKSATITNNVSTIINGSLTATSLPQTFVGALVDPISGLASNLSTYNSKGFLDARTVTTSTTFNGGTGTVTNNGEVRGDSGFGVGVTAEGTATFTNSVTGVVGQFLGGTGAGSNWFGNPTFNFVNAIQVNTSQTIADSGLTDLITLLSDPTHGTTVTTNTFTAVGGAANAVNSGVIWGSIDIAGATGSFTNNTGASLGCGSSGGGVCVGSSFGSGGGVFFGQYVKNYTTVTTTKANVTTYSETIPTPFNQTYTANQNGVIVGGISVFGAFVQDPLGTLATPPNVDAFGQVKLVQTSNIAATINLNDRSVTLGANEDGDSRLSVNAAVVGEMGVFDSNLAQFMTTTNVNLSGNDYLGLNTNAFLTFPILTKQQTQFLSTVFGISTDSMALDAAFAAGTSNVPGLTLNSPVSVTGVNALVRNAGGITFFTGVNYFNGNSPRLVDDTYAIRVNTFTVASGGEMQFAMDFQPLESFSSSSCSALFNSNFCALNAPQPASNIFGISGAVTNNGTFVLGARAVEVAPANFGSFSVSSPSFIEGLTFRMDGSFTQSATGILVTGIVPALVRQFEPAIVNPTVGAILGTPSGGLTLPLFTTPLKSGIPTSTPSLVMLSGNLNLAGTVQVQVSRNSLYAANQITPLFIVTPTIAPTTGVVSATAPTVAVTATVTTSLPSAFVGFALTTSTTGTGASTVTTVSLISQRKSFSTAGLTTNAQAAGHALDSDIGSIVPQITADANGNASFADVGTEDDVQDEANLISNLDFFVSPAQAGAVLQDLAGGSFYGSLRAFDTTRVQRDSFDDLVAGVTDKDQVGLTIWGSPVFRSTKLDGDSSIGTGDINSDEGGVTAGVDLRFTNNIGLGFSGGYTKSRIKDTDPATADVNSYMIGTNIYYVSGPLHVSGQIDYARSDYSVNRQMPNTGDREAHAEFGGTQFRGNAEAGYTFYMVAADGDLTPYISVDWRHADIHGFSESGAGGVNLVVDGKSDGVFAPRLGLRWVGTPWGTTVFSMKPKIEGSWTFTDDMNTDTTAHLAGGDDPIVTKGIQGKGYGNVNVGLVGAVGTNGTFGITGGFDFAGNRTATSISANFTLHM